MKYFLFWILFLFICSLSLFIVGVCFYLGIEIFFYFYGDLPISFEWLQFKRMLKISMVGGGIGGTGLALLSIFKVKGFNLR